ncbi:MAG: hypothetical protein AAFR12_13505 [Cyanobacteria bacterium J06626_6]
MSETNTFSLSGLVNNLLDDLKAIAQTAEPLQTRQDIENLSLLQSTRSQFQTVSTSLSTQQEQQVEQQKQTFTQRREIFQLGLQQRQQLIEQVTQQRRELLTRPVPDKFVVTGQILDEETGNGLPNVHIQVFDFDRQADDVIGKTITDTDGFYRLEYTREQFQDRNEGNPEVYIQVKDEANETLFQSPRTFDNNEGTVKTVNARVDGTKLPTSRAIAIQVIESRSRRIATLIEKQQARQIRNFGQISLQRPSAPIRNVIINPTRLPTIATPPVRTPTVRTPTVRIPTVRTPTVRNPITREIRITNPSITSPQILNPVITNPSITNPSITNRLVTPTEDADS